MASRRSRWLATPHDLATQAAVVSVCAALVLAVLADMGPRAQFVTLNSGEYDNDSPVDQSRNGGPSDGGRSGPMSIAQRRFASDCNRVPSGAISERSPGSGGFSIRISGSPKNFVPREGYTG